MKVAVINEGSTKHRNADIMRVISRYDLTVYNVGMKNVEQEPDLNYLETGFLSALLFNLGVVDFVVGGCGTGQGYMNAVLQYPKMACGLIIDPTDAYLFAKVNCGNCISLSLNKGYGGVGADLNLGDIFDKLFMEPFGGGYPPHRAAIQNAAREKLEKLSLQAHYTCKEIIEKMDRQLLKSALSFPGIMELVETAGEINPEVTALKMTVIRSYHELSN